MVKVAVATIGSAVQKIHFQKLSVSMTVAVELGVSYRTLAK